MFLLICKLGKRKFDILNFSNCTFAITRERMIIGSVSYRNRYWVYRIESYRLLLYWLMLRASLQVQQLLTGRIPQQIKGHSRPFTRGARATHACSRIRERVGGQEEGDCNLTPATPRHQDGADWSWPSPPPPAGSDINSQLSIILTSLRITQS